MRHTRGKPHYPMFERWPLSLKSRLLLENYYPPGNQQRAIADFVDQYNHRRYNESLDNLTLADVYFGRGKCIKVSPQKWRGKLDHLALRALAESKA